MKDDTFELLTKMYSEFSEFRREANARFDKLEAGQAKLDAGQAKIATTLEHDVKNNLKLLNEQVTANTEKLDDHTERLATIENKLDYLALSVNAQDKRLEVVESSRRKKVK